MRVLLMLPLVACLTKAPELECPNVGAPDPRVQACQMAAACSLVKDEHLPDCEYCLAMYASFNTLDLPQYVHLLEKASCKDMQKYGEESGVLQCAAGYGTWRNSVGVE